ncbi:hypothetical protein [Comamonas thiooxydans]|uniref:hypothetical protein n=1 Tax=Comamonas thiooxydans TaxID=363952 RepID=UPI00103B6DB2|nr:hypothetical protein [Comamonas thiooxydans]
MFNSKKTAAVMAFAIFSFPALAQTIGDIAAYQRAKMQSQIKGEPLQSIPSPAPSVPAQQESGINLRQPSIKPIYVIATYEVDGTSKALISNHGSTSSVAAGDKVNQYEVHSIKMDKVNFQPLCKKKTKSRCKIIGVNVGGGL